MTAESSPSPFSLSDACRASRSVTPLADRRRRRFLIAWIPLVLLVAAAALYWGGLFAGVGAGLAGAALWRRFWKRANRRRALWRASFPAKSEKFLLRRIPQYRSLDGAGRALFRERAKVFLDEVAFHDVRKGVGGEAGNGLRLRAAAAAVAPTLGFEEWEWPRLKEIIFRPEGYERGVYQDEGGVVTEFAESGMTGAEGVMSGTVMLSSEDLLWEFAHPEEGANVGFHEFAHVMAAQGLALAERDRGGWAELMRREAVRVEQGASLLDEYALLNGDEFFAVATELFFTVPRRFRSWHRELYGVLARCYRQDPAVWLDTGEPPPDSPPPRRRRRRRVKT